MFKYLGTSIMETKEICEEIRVRIAVCSHGIMVYNIFKSRTVNEMKKIKIYKKNC
jgi:hypothetical protein